MREKLIIARIMSGENNLFYIIKEQTLENKIKNEGKMYADIFKNE